MILTRHNDRPMFSHRRFRPYDSSATGKIAQGLRSHYAKHDNQNASQASLCMKAEPAVRSTQLLH